MENIVVDLKNIVVGQGILWLTFLYQPQKCYGSNLHVVYKILWLTSKCLWLSSTLWSTLRLLSLCIEIVVVDLKLMWFFFCFDKVKNNLVR